MFFKSLFEHCRDLGPGFAQGGVLRSGDLDGAVLIDAPAAAEVADINVPVVAEFDVAGADAFDQLALLDRDVAGPARFGFDEEQVAVVGSTAVVREEKFAAQIFGQGLTGEPGYARGTLRDVRSGRVDPLRLVFGVEVEHFFLHPHGLLGAKGPPIEMGRVVVG